MSGTGEDSRIDQSENAESTRGSSRASLLTPVGRGAVAVVAVQGPAGAAAIDACFDARNGRSHREQPIGAIVYGAWRSSAPPSCVSEQRDDSCSSTSEDLILCRRDSQVTEIHCHGGVAPAERILKALAAFGCVVENWRIWGRRAENRIAAEACEALATASTRRAAAVLLDQWHGALKREADGAAVHLNAGRFERARVDLQALLRREDFGKRITVPPRVVVAGQPNVGKSSLVNALVGYQRSIVLDYPGVTRDALSVDLAIDGWPLQLVDLAGIGDSRDALAAAADAQARREIATADLVLWVLDAGRVTPDAWADPLRAADREWKTACFRQAGAIHEGEKVEPFPYARALAAINKWDLVDEGATTHGATLAVSASTGAGLGSLRKAIVARLFPKPPEPGAGVPFCDRHYEALHAAEQAVKRGDAASAISALKLL